MQESTVYKGCKQDEHTVGAKTKFLLHILPTAVVCSFIAQNMLLSTYAKYPLYIDAMVRNMPKWNTVSKQKDNI